MRSPSFLLTPLSPQSATLPAGLRQKDQTQKAATGPFDREHLLMYLEKEALEQKDREDFVPFTGEKKGEARAVPWGQRSPCWVVSEAQRGAIPGNGFLALWAGGAQLRAVVVNPGHAGCSCCDH